MGLFDSEKETGNIDIDQIEALSAEREALWMRLEKASFLTLNEKRAAAGYGPVDGGDGGGEKCNQDHDDAVGPAQN